MKRLGFLVVFSAFLLTNSFAGGPQKQGYFDAAGLSFYSPYDLTGSTSSGMPGIKINLDHYLKTVSSTRAGAEYLIGVNGGYYGKTDLHTAYYLNAATMARYTTKGGFMLEAEFNLGIMKRIIDNVEKQKFLDDFGGTSAFTAGIGADLYRGSNLPAIIKLKGGVLAMYPTGEEMLMPLLEINITYLFGKGSMY